MINYNWEVLSLYTTPSVDGMANVIKRVTWRCQVTEGSYYADVYRDTLLASPDPTAFVQYENLDNDTIIEWVKQSENIPTIEAELLEKLEIAKNPPIEDKKLPWVFTDYYNPRVDLYVFTVDGEVVYGPVHWHSDCMNTELERYGAPKSIPDDVLAFRKGIVPLDTPLIINDSIKIYKAQMINSQHVDNPYYSNGHTAWDFSTGIAIGTYEQQEKPLDQAKLDLLKVLSDQVSNHENTDMWVTIQNQSFKVEASIFYRTCIQTRYSIMNDNDTTIWKFKDNGWLRLSKAEMFELMKTIENRVQSIWEWEYNSSQRIDAVTSIQELISVCEEIFAEGFTLFPPNI